MSSLATYRFPSCLTPSALWLASSMQEIFITQPPHATFPGSNGLIAYFSLPASLVAPFHNPPAPPYLWSTSADLGWNEPPGSRAIVQGGHREADVHLQHGYIHLHFQVTSSALSFICSTFFFLWLFSFYFFFLQFMQLFFEPWAVLLSATYCQPLALYIELYCHNIH